jgi:hypothetical protein
MLQPFVVDVAIEKSSGSTPTDAASLPRTSSRSASARSK